MDKPVVLVVSDKPSILTTLEADLRRRFEADYQVLTSADGEAAVAVVADAAPAASRSHC